MKTSSRLMLAVSAALVGGIANAQISPYPSTGSDIVLFVTDLTTATGFYQDLGVTINALGVTTSTVQADFAAGNAYSLFGLNTPGPMGNGSPLVVGAGLITGGIDTSLAAFTSSGSNKTTDNYTYGLLASAAGDGSTGVGQQRLLASFNAAYATGAFSDEPATANLGATVTGNGNFFAAVNSAKVSNGSGSSQFYTYTNPPSFFGGSGGAGAQAASNYSLTAHTNNNPLGTAVYFEEFAGFGDGSDANVYLDPTAVTFSSTGAVTGLVSGTTPVPLPPAIWLLGGGVIGLFGIARRRDSAKAAVA